MSDPFIDDPRVARALESSVLLGAVSRVVHAVWRAAATSRAAAVVLDLQRDWSARPRAAHRVAIGVLLIAAAATNLVLAAANQRPAGWLWIVPPAIAASIGGLLLISANGARD